MSDTDQTPVEAPEENLADVHDSATAKAEAVAGNDPAPGAEPAKVNKEARYRTERNAARAERDALALVSSSSNDSTSNG